MEIETQIKPLKSTQYQMILDAQSVDSRDVMWKIILPIK